jgi:hypothetical protein
MDRSNIKKSKTDKLKIQQRAQQSFNLFMSLNLESLQEIKKTGKVNVTVNDKEVKFSCSSTDTVALYQAIKYKQNKK